MAIVYNKEVYNQVTETLTENQAYIEELYVAFSSMSFEEQLIATDVIDNLKTLNYEYEKYIIVYEAKVEEKNQNTDYVIIYNDTLPRIAQKTLGDFGRWQEIFDLNNLKDIYLVEGDVLRIPRK
jgi:nucleoid-associated protein YgaU